MISLVDNTNRSSLAQRNFLILDIELMYNSYYEKLDFIEKQLLG